MNILANTIDLFDEMTEQSRFAELAAHLQTLTIQTALTGSTVKTRIYDNGKGYDGGSQSPHL
jgi:hypothetical protein